MLGWPYKDQSISDFHGLKFRPRNAKVGNFPKTEQLIEGNDLPSGHCMHLRKSAEMGDSMQR